MIVYMLMHGPSVSLNQQDSCSMRHSIYNHKSGTEIIVFAPAEVSYDDVLKAFHPYADWSYVRPTSHRCDKWVYYPKENAENV